MCRERIVNVSETQLNVQIVNPAGRRRAVCTLYAHRDATVKSPGVNVYDKIDR